MDETSARAALDGALQAALVRQLAETWDEVNANYFRHRLRRPVFALGDSTVRLGSWDGRTRTLTVSRVLILRTAWAIVREVVKHEVAHQYVEEELGVRNQPAHGPAFEAVCRQHGFDAAAAGLPSETGGGSPGDGGAGQSAILRRVGRLLALAESPNVHEAEAAMKAAQRLMLLHNIDAAAAAARDGYAFRQVGTPTGRIPAAEQVLAGILSRHFFVDVIWVPSYEPATGRAGRVLELCGTPSNLDVAAYVHGFVLETAERLWRDHRRARGLAGNRDRRRYLMGVMLGFDEKLKAADQDNRREGLIWKGDPGLGAFLRRRYPRRTGGASVGVAMDESVEHGRRAGRGIVLHRPVQGEAPSGARGRLLGPATSS